MIGSGIILRPKQGQSEPMIYNFRIYVGNFELEDPFTLQHWTPGEIKNKVNNKTNKNKSLEMEKKQVLIASFEILGLTMLKTHLLLNFSVM